MLGADHTAGEAREWKPSPGGKIAVAAGERVDGSALRLFALAQICSILVEQHFDGPAFCFLLLGQRCVGIDAAFDKANDILGLGTSLLEGQFLSGAQGVAHGFDQGAAAALALPQIALHLVAFRVLVDRQQQAGHLGVAHYRLGAERQALDKALCEFAGRENTCRTTSTRAGAI